MLPYLMNSFITVTIKLYVYIKVIYKSQEFHKKIQQAPT